MTKDSKLSRISDSASGGNGESMAREGRFKIVRLHERRRLVVDTLYSDMPVAQFWESKIGGRHEDPQLMAEECAARLEQIALRISETPAQSSEARPGVGTAVESKTVDEKGLASRVEELEKGLREAIETLEIAEYHVSAEKLRTVLAGAHAEEKPND